MSSTSDSAKSCPDKCYRLILRGLPRLILIISYIFYLLFGGLIFSLIEGPRYKELVDQEHDIERQAEEAREIVLKAFGNTSKEADKELADARLRALVFAAEHPGLITGSNNETVVIGNEWSFGNSVIFCMTTITTIGYGHLVTHTTLGKYACMVYTCFGIPFSFLLLADAGYLSAVAIMKALNKCFRKCCKCCMNNGSHRPNRTRRNSRDDKHVGDDGRDAENGDSSGMRDRTTDLGNPDDVETVNGGGSPDDVINVDYTDTAHPDQCKHDVEMDDDALLDDVPVLVVPVFFWSFIIFSAPMYIMFEGWSFTTSIYFTFFSITTVGFGDIFPESPMGLIHAWMGLVVTSTCIFLSYRRLIRLAKWILAVLNSMVNKDYQRKRDTHYSNIQG